MKRFLSRHNWRGLRGLLRCAADPLEAARRLYLKAGSYPCRMRLRTPIGPVELELHAHDDLITVHEIFFREDYRQPGSRRSRTVVDFGANIGVASAYFLSRNDQVRVFAYEPVPRNIARARRNLAPFADRLEFNECAVGTASGTIAFGIEPTGRYGGIGLAHAEQIEVPCRLGAAELARIRAARGRIDLLKLDIEDMEIPILHSLGTDTLSAIGAVVAECDGAAVHLPGFTRRQYLSVARFTRAA